MAFIEVANLKKIYSSKFSLKTVEALKSVNFEVEKGEFVAIMGESGSGKSTLLNILALLDRATDGSVMIDGRDISKISESESAKYRRTHLGFVFQDYNLLDTLTIKENIVLPLVLSEEKPTIMQNKLRNVAGILGIEDLIDKYPYEVSGGQAQRAAIARSLITSPDLILADEPTGALDSNSSNTLLEYFDEINKSGQTILMVTHSVKAASYASRVLFIKDGEIFHQLYRANRQPMEMYQDIMNTLTNLGGKN